MSDEPKEVPQYRVKTKTFVAPHMLQAGSVILTWSEPGDHLEPLNSAARDAMDRWYNKEYPEKDKDGVPIRNADGTPRMFKPNYSKRELAQPAAPHTVADVVLVSHAPTQTAADAQRISDAVMRGPVVPDLVPTGGPVGGSLPVPTSLPTRPTSPASHPTDLAPGAPDADTEDKSFSGDTLIVSTPPADAPANRNAPPVMRPAAAAMTPPLPSI